MRTIPVEQFRSEIKAIGLPANEVPFRCPRCKQTQTIKDFEDHGLSADEARNRVGQECIGRTKKERGCDWALYGLLQIHELVIVDESGKEHPHFEIGDPR